MNPVKRAIYAFFMSWGMFCSIPNPCRIWDERARQWMLVEFPFIGLLIGAVWMGLARLFAVLSMLTPLTAAVLTVTPYLLTGFIHLDGFMDCCDAILSRRDLPERQRILKDSHTGAFAVIALAILFLLGYGAFASAGPETNFLCLLFLPVAPRVASAVAIDTVRPMGTSQYAGAYRQGVPKGQVAVLAAEFLAVSALAVLFCGRAGWSVPIAGACGALAAARGIYWLDGMSGDISGFCVTLGELAGVIAMTLL